MVLVAIGGIFVEDPLVAIGMSQLIARLTLSLKPTKFANCVAFYSTSTATKLNFEGKGKRVTVPGSFSAATTASSEFRKILFHLPQLNIANSPAGFLLSSNDFQAALSPLQESIDTSDYIEPTLRHLLSLPLQSKPQINKFNSLQAREYFAQSPNDTGSVEVQCGQLTARMLWLGEHCAGHKHDYTAQRKIVELVAIRRKFLRYLRTVSLERFYKLLDQLSLPPNYLEAFEASCSYKSKQKASAFKKSK